MPQLKIKTELIIEPAHLDLQITSDLVNNNKEPGKPLDEATTKAASLQSELLDTSKTIDLEMLDAFDVAGKRFKNNLDNKDWRNKDQTEVEEPGNGPSRRHM